MVSSITLKDNESDSDNKSELNYQNSSYEPQIRKWILNSKTLKQKLNYVSFFFIYYYAILCDKILSFIY